VSANPAGEGGGLPFRLENGLFANSSGLASAGVVSPISEAGCAESQVELFPSLAAIESRFLGLSTSRNTMFEAGLADYRREVVELGDACSRNVSELQRARGVFEVDCNLGLITCETQPSLPFRRVGNQRLRVRVETAGGRVWVEDDARLSGLPGLVDPADSVLAAVVKLCVLTLLAAVTWYRASRAGTSHVSVFLRSTGAAVAEENANAAARLEDGLVAATAVAVRIGVASWRLGAFYEDGILAVVVLDLVGGLLSFLHVLVRYIALKGDDGPAVVLLGGSSAALDVIAAGLMSFAAPPLLSRTSGSFDPTARFLISLLVTSLGLSKTCFGCAACLVKRERAKGVNVSYSWLLLVSAAVWAFQAVTLGAITGVTFAAPFAFSSTVLLQGTSHSTGALVLAVVVSAAMPAFTADLGELAAAKV
jgi:hypothetical protein